MARTPHSSSSIRTRWWLHGAVLATLMLALAACSAGGEDTTAESREADGGDDAAHLAEPDAPRDAAEELDDAARAEPGSGGIAEGGDAPDATRDADEAAGEATDSPPRLPTGGGERVIKEGTVRVEVPEGEFDDAFAAVVDAARRHGGSVLSSSTRTQPDERTAGSVTVRVPADAFEDLVVSVGGIGEIRERNITARDVTTEFVDLESRLRHLEAQERFYLGLLEEAESVSDAIGIQQQLEQIQSQIEQVKGRLRYLEERTSFSTLTVELFESGAEPPVAEGERPTLASYWDTARDALVHVLGGMLVAAFFVVPLLVLAAIAFAVWRGLRRRPSPPPATPPAAESPTAG